MDELREKVIKLKDFGITYVAMAKAAGINYGTFKNWVRGQTISEEKMHKIKEYLDTFQK